MRNAIAWWTKTVATAALALQLLAVGTTAQAAPPQTIAYQGYLTTTASAPVNGTQTIVFSLYAAASGGSGALWTETQSVTVANGNYSVILGNSNPISLPFDAPYYLGVRVTTLSSSEPEMTPRVALTSAPYAFRALNLDAAASIPGTQITGTIAGSQITGSLNTAVTVQGSQVSGALAPSATIGGLQITGSITTTNNISTAGPTGTATGNITVGGNLLLSDSLTGSVGNVIKNNFPFIHNFGTQNTFIGRGAGNFTITGPGNNTAAGHNALLANTNGAYNTAVGAFALTANTTGSYNSASGPYALQNNTTSSYNSASGPYALAQNTSGSYNAAHGPYALQNNTNGSYNTALGAYALGSTTTGNVIGYSSYNTAIGPYALQSNAYGYNNTAVGAYALWKNANGTPVIDPAHDLGVPFGGVENTAVGAYALQNNTTGYWNTALGTQALGNNTFGFLNSTNGAYALYSNSLGNYNTANGGNALFGNTTGSNNVATGSFALANNQISNDNTAIGMTALFYSTGARNTAVGSGALLSLTGGSDNIALGYNAGTNLPSGSNNIYIGNVAGAAVESKTIRIGDANQANTYIAGISAQPVAAGAFPVLIDGNSKLGTSGDMTVNSNINFSTSTLRQMLNLWGSGYGIGVQNFAMYFRTGSEFEWYRSGTHNDTLGDPANGTWLMRLGTGGLYVNGALVSTSDRNAKEDFEAVDSTAILEKVAGLPISAWSFKNDEKKTRHLGPMAQDFHAAFEIGPDDKHIATVDEGGVALAAIQGLYSKLMEKERRIDVQAAEIAMLQRDRDAQIARISELERKSAEIAQLKEQTAELAAALKRLGHVEVAKR